MAGNFVWRYICIPRVCLLGVHLHSEGVSTGGTLHSEGVSTGGLLPTTLCISEALFIDVAIVYKVGARLTAMLIMSVVNPSFYLIP